MIYRPIKDGVDFLAKKKEERQTEINSITDLVSNWDDLKKTFVRPKIQNYNPMDDTGPEDQLFNTDAFEYIDKFVSKEVSQKDGRTQLFVLGGAGMGKTSLLAMYRYIKLKATNSKYDYRIFKIESDVLERIKNANLDKGKTVLFLDALDEDRSAYGNIKKRVGDLLRGTQSYKAVLITCRTQFFPKTDEEEYLRQDQLKISGFKCPVKYLSFFSEDQVDEYLNNKFDDHDKIKKSKKIISKMGDLSMRPMLLSYVDDLLDKKIENIFDIYDELVKAWLSREARKTGLNENELQNVSILLARHLMSNGLRNLPEVKLVALLKSKKLETDLDLIEVGGKSLLNKDSDGRFRFAHLSFQEFLVVKSILVGKGWIHKVSDVMIMFLKAAIQLGSSGINLSGTNLSGTNLSGFCLRGADLSEANLSEANMRSVDLDGADLRTANMKSANLTRADLSGAKMNGTNLQLANLKGANLNRANLSESILINSRLNGASMVNTNLSGANLAGADLTGTKLHGATLDKTNLTGVRIDWARLNQAKLGWAKMNEAKIGWTVKSLDTMKVLKKTHFPSKTSKDAVKRILFS